VLCVVVTLVVRMVLKPVERVRRELLERQSDDLSPLKAASASNAPAELQPVFTALNEVMARLGRLTEHQQAFIRNASHQLRTPLAVMKTQIALAERGDMSHADALKALSATAERATHLTNQLLALAKIEQIRSNAQFLPVDVCEVARTIALELSPLIADKNLDFELQLALESASVLGHEWMLRELVRNLLANAIAHTPPGGKLGVQVGSQAGSQLRLSVWNHSAPIPAELLARLFTPFSGDSVGSAGVGLGLAICKDVCEWLGGSVSLTQTALPDSTPPQVLVRTVALLPVHSATTSI
jgi:two-component system, OmpR family, sensor histidine kinase TctE